MPNVLYSESDSKREIDPPVRESTGPEDHRSPYRRDYARLIHSPAFRRLQGKTQVFPGDESDFFRNRLTHSLEVAQIAKSIAIRLNATHEFFREHPVDIDLVELAGLAHHLGHPPFGHNGEAALDDCMKCAGGFEGNAQTFHILTKIEKKQLKGASTDPVDSKGVDQRLGLNFAYRSLAAIAKYDCEIPRYRKNSADLVKGIYGSDFELFSRVKEAVCPQRAESGDFKTIECSIMDLADDIAYSTYDLEDTFKAGFLSPLDILSSDAELFKRVAKKASDTLGAVVGESDILSVFLDVFSGLEEGTAGKGKTSRSADEELYNAAQYVVSSNQMATNGYVRTQFTADLVSEFIASIQVEVNESSPVMSRAFLTEDSLLKVEALKHYTFEATIMAPRLRVSEQRGQDLVKRMFEKLDTKKGHLLLPQDFRDLYERFLDDAEKKRVVCNFIAGMTDRYAVEFYGRIFSENPQSIFKPF